MLMQAFSLQILIFKKCFLYLPLFLAFFLACGEPVTEFQLEIGTGAAQFEALVEGQELAIIAGPQGGYHFIINARMQGFLPGFPLQPGLLGNPQTRFSIFLENGEQVDIQANPYRLGYQKSLDSWYELPAGRFLRLSDNLIASENLLPNIYGQRVRLEVRLRDAKGQETKASQWVVAVENKEN